MSIVRRDQFTGSNNIAKPERLPEGAVVDAVNMDFTVGGKAELRTGFQKIRDGQNIRAIFSMADGAIAIVEGSQLIKLHNGVETNLATLSAGPVAATTHNSKLYLNTMAESIVVDSLVSKWAIEPPAFDASIVSGSMQPGIYKVAITKVVNGRESGCIPAVVTISEGQAIVVEADVDTGCRLYASVANGQTLYYQGVASSYNRISNPVDDTARLETAMLTPLPFCENLISHQGLIIGSNGRYLFHTKPMHPHLHNPESDYMQFPSDISVIASVANGIYVCADKTYFISGIGGPEMAQTPVADFGAIPNTAVDLPDGSAAWFSKYGQVVGRADGVVDFINKSSYAPETASSGSAGYLEHNGNQMIVTTMRGEQRDSRLKSTDYWDIEVI